MNTFNKIIISLVSVLAISCGSEQRSKPLKGDNIKLPKAPVEKMSVIEIQEILDGEGSDAEDSKLLNWHHYDLTEDSLFGVSSSKTFESLNLKQEREIIVAVIDSGVDVKHEDLKEVIWINKNEIPGNGLDDDNNGYIDDIHGWNFLGGSDGRHIDEETLEVTRIYKTLLDKLQNGEILNNAEDLLFEKVKMEVEENLLEYTDMYNEANKDSDSLKSKLVILKQKLSIEELKSRNDIEKINSTEAQIVRIKADLLTMWDSYRGGFSGIARVISISKYYSKAGYNIDFNARKEIVGDDPSDFSDTAYGNNDVKGPDSSHGTHVSGSIAAKRDNGMGMNGIAGNVKIMALRAVPNGDERDKDIALAVRYAADNGAHIINMSFGKGYSPYKKQVDEAFEYAASKGVLLLHAAGNSSKSVDGGTDNFPNSYKLGKGVLTVDTIPNWIEVGASTKDLGLDLVASFSNFGNEAVTLFSPGRNIYSTTPDNTYAAYSGTSMATPVAAGVAALLMSEFPTMTGLEAKNIILHTVTKKANLEVRKPGENVRNPDFRLPVPFKSLSQQDGVINAEAAIELATKLSN